MKKSKLLKAEFYITDDGIVYKWDDLPKEKKDEYKKEMTENCFNAMTNFYQQNPQYL